jgi:hypothetical protein
MAYQVKLHELGLTIVVDYKALPIVAGGLAGDNTLAISDDGINWTGLGTDIFTGACHDIAYNGDMLVAVGESSAGAGVLAHSYDGISWITDSSPLGGALYTVCWSSELKIWVIGGEPLIDGSDKYSTAFSYTGTWWTAADDPTQFATACHNIAWDGEVFLATGILNDDPLYSSVDGINWTEVTTWDELFASGPGRKLGTAYGWMMGGTSSITYPTTLALFDLDSAVDWGKTLFESQCNALAYDDDGLVVAGGVGTNTLAYAAASDVSSEGAWTGLGLIGLGGVSDISFGSDASQNPIWISIGWGTEARPYELAYSYNGIDWESVSEEEFLFNIGYCVCAGEEHYVELITALLDAYGPRVWMM